MKKSSPQLLLLFIGAFALAAIAQSTPSPSPTPNQDEVIRISSKLVLLDALVLDKDNKQVKNLGPEDFTVRQDGVIQKITNFGYISGARQKSKIPNAAADEKKSGRNSLPWPPVSMREEKGRFITFVIDDGNCLATLSGLATARDGINKFIDRQMLPDDRVAIYRTRPGSNLLQVYTSNKDVLKRIVGKVKWVPSTCGSAFNPAKDNSTMKPTGSFESAEDRQAREDRDRVFRSAQMKGTIGVLNFVIDRLKRVPRRKLLFFVSEGLPVEFGNNDFNDLKDVIDRAIRSSVVIYSISEKGLSIPGFIAAQDEVSARIIDGEDDITPLRESRIAEERSLNDGLAFLSYSTGGKFIRNKSFFAPEIEKVLDVETGYYLLGYEPDDENFEGKKYHRIEVKLNRDDLRVFSPKGFYGRDDQPSPRTTAAGQDSLYRAIASPLAANSLELRLTTLVGDKAGQGKYIRALLHINGEDLTFTNSSRGSKLVELNVVMATLNEKGKVVGEFNHSYPIKIPESRVAFVKKNGLDYSTDLMIKKPGFYSFRLAVEDKNSKRIGSAVRMVRIPKGGKDEVQITGLLTTSITRDSKPLWTRERPIDKAFAPVFVRSIPSVRQYYPGAPLAYVFTISNAKREKTSKLPRLRTQIRLYKDGELLVEGKRTPLKIEDASNSGNIRDYAFLRLSKNAKPGEYILQLIVEDMLTNRTATRWIDFEVIETPSK